jgi:curli biogenesis system outer membrane secretion channel CsgG
MYALWPEKIDLTMRKRKVDLMEGDFGSSTGGKSTLAVADFTPQDVSAGNAAIIAELFRTEMVKGGTFDVVEKANMDKVLAEQAFQQTGCTSSECAVKLGKVLNVRYLVVGSFGKLMDSYILNIRVVDVGTAKVVYSDSSQGKDVPAVQAAIRDMAAKLSGSVGGGD